MHHSRRSAQRTLQRDANPEGACTWRRPELLAFGSLVALLVIARHRGNIVRLLQGTEHKVGERTPAGQ